MIERKKLQPDISKVQQDAGSVLNFITLGC